MSAVSGIAASGEQDDGRAAAFTEADADLEELTLGHIERHVIDHRLAVVAFGDPLKGNRRATRVPDPEYEPAMLAIGRYEAGG
jgi:hypothetical protein